MFGLWHSAVFTDINPKRYDSIILFIEDRINGERILIGRNEDTIPVILQVIQQTGAPLQMLLCHWCNQHRFLGTYQIFFSHLFAHSLNSGDWDFLFLYPSCHFLAQVGSENFLMPSWLTTWDFPDRKWLFKDSEIFKHCSNQWTVILPTFSCLKSQFSWNPCVTKWIFQFF